MNDTHSTTVRLRRNRFYSTYNTDTTFTFNRRLLLRRNRSRAIEQGAQKQSIHETDYRPTFQQKSAKQTKVSKATAKPGEAATETVAKPRKAATEQRIHGSKAKGHNKNIGAKFSVTRELRKWYSSKPFLTYPVQAQGNHFSRVTTHYTHIDKHSK